VVSLAPLSADTKSAPSGATDARLRRDWQLLCADPRVEDIIGAWGAQSAALAGCRTAGDVVERMGRLYRAGDWAGHDQAFAALLCRAAGAGPAGDVAWRLAVRAMLPKAARMARTQVRPGIGYEEAFSAVVSALFEVVRTFPLERTPRNIYAGLALRTLTLARKILGYRADHLPFTPEVMIEIVDSGPGRYAPEEPAERFERLRLLLDAAELHLLCADDPAQVYRGSARAEVLRLVVWAVQSRVLSLAEAQELARYYVTRAAPGARAAGAEDARRRKARSRAVRRLRDADHRAYFQAVA
jgi:hypothetical protein